MVPSRKRRGLAEIQLRIAEFKSSGPSKTAFPARVGVHPLSMDRWLRITHPTPAPQPPHFIASQNSPAFVPVLFHQRRHRVKILFWNKSGWWLCAKRLESGTLAWPDSAERVIELSNQQRTLLLS